MKASVIIPAYNAKNYIKTVIDSLLVAPPSFDFEILVIDDGSTDGTDQFLQNLAHEHSNLHYFVQKNAGPAAARNLGIQKARGDYLLFCDSDDAVLPHALERAVSACEESGADLLIFGYRVVQEGEEFDYSYPEATLLEQEDWKEHLARLYRANMLNQVWGKVFSARLIREHQLEFPLELWGEDRLFIFSVLEQAKKVAVIPDPLYRYIQQKNSLISRFIPNKADVCVRAHRAVTALAEKKGAGSKEADEIFAYMYVKSLLSVLATLYSPSCNLTVGQKRRFVKEVLSQPEIGLLGAAPKSAGKSFALLFALVKSKNVTLNLLAAWGMKFISRTLPGLFRKQKHIYNK